MRFCLSAIFLFVTLCCCSLAAGTEENGFHLSENTILHISFFLAPEFRTNVYNISERSRVVENLNTGRSYNYTETNDIILHMMPGLRLDHDDNFQTLGAAVSLNYNLYTGMSDKESYESFTTLDSLHFSGDLLGEFNKEGSVIVRVVNNIKRNSDPDMQELESGRHLAPFEDLTFTEKKLHTEFPVNLNFSESGGSSHVGEDLTVDFYLRNSDDSLSMKISSALLASYFDDLLARPWGFLSSRSRLSGVSKFVPQLSAFFDISFTYQEYPWATGTLRDTQGSMPISLLLGIISPLSPEITLKIAGGYVNSLSDEYHHDGVAGAEFLFNREDLFSRLSYKRILSPNFIYRYLVEDRVSFEYAQKFFDKLLLQLDVSYAHFQYGKNMKYPSLTKVNTVTDTDTGAVTTTTFTQKSIDREDHLVRIEPMISYYFFPWLGLSLKYTLETNLTPFFASTRIVREGFLQGDITDTTYYDYMSHRVLLALVLDY